MTKLELISSLTRTNDVFDEYKVSECVNEIFDYLAERVNNGEKVEIRGFGCFSLRIRQSRVGRNPKTGESVNIPERKVIFFKPGKELNLRINGKYHPSQKDQSETDGF